MSGEGIVAEFMGPGELLIQTRNLAALAGLLKPFFPSQGGGRWRLQSQLRRMSAELTKAVSIVGVPLGYGASMAGVDMVRQHCVSHV
jgi:hypothetical protein